MAKNIRTSPEKMRLLVDQIKKMTPAKSLAALDFVPTATAKPLKKVVASAVANAKNNFGLDEETLIFKSILVGKGPVFKRFRAVARGRAHAILKKTSHITVILEGQPKKEIAKVPEVSKTQEVSKTPETKPEVKNQKQNEKIKL